MAKATFKLNVSGVRALMKSEAVGAMLMEHAEETAEVAEASADLDTTLGIREPMYAAYLDEGRYTLIGKAVASTKYGRIDNKRNGTLLKSLR